MARVISRVVLEVCIFWLLAFIYCLFSLHIYGLYWSCCWYYCLIAVVFICSVFCGWFEFAFALFLGRVLGGDVSTGYGMAGCLSIPLKVVVSSW